MKKILFIMAGILLASLSFGIWRLGSPYPSPLNWDILEHQTITNKILAGNFAVLPSQLSDTFRFDGYTTLFHVLVAGTQYITPISTLGYWWITEFLMTVVVVLATMFLAHAFTKNTWVTFLAGIFSAFSFESTTVFTPYFFIPQNVSALLFVLALALAIATRLQKPMQKILFALLITSMVLMHFIVGAFGIGLLAIVGLFKNRTNGNDRTTMTNRTYTTIIFTLPILMYSIAVLVSRAFPLSAINFGEAQYFTQDALKTLESMRHWESFLPLLLIPLGIAGTYTLGNRGKLLGILFAVSFTSAFLPLPYTLKFYALGRFFTAILLALGTYRILTMSRSPWIRTAVCVSLGFTLLATLSANTSAWKQSITFRGIASQVQPKEREAAVFLAKKFRPSEAFLISDPATQYILEALTGFESQGGAYMSGQTRNIIVNALKPESANPVCKGLSAIHDGLPIQIPSHVLLVASARLFRWLESDQTNRNAITYNIWRPDDLTITDEIAISALKERIGSEPIYQNSSLAVFDLGACL